jgi:hypothetical protein
MADGTPGVVRIQVNIEPCWTASHDSTVIQVEADELEGLDAGERTAVIGKLVEDYVNERCPWGWTEVAGGRAE